MKRVQILARATPVSEIDDLDTDDYLSSKWHPKAERARIRNYRRVKQQEV